uniref:Rhomboid-related protein 4-like isoform X2 n=1 Tax=Phascolarctos cinereus TaxID=38626 RepID=A0A6P5JKU2_PHACI|nr:rhomboid-related protein 4-like isoform X2 [Phascolarctos cinereus]
MVLLAKQLKGPAPWPQVTVGTISFIISLFLWPLVDPSNACFSLDTAKHWWLLLLAPVHHENPWHLACNVAGLWLTGRRMEQSVGTGVLFAMQVMSSSENTLVGDLLLCLAESLVASYFAPKISFSGHLAGVLVGLAYIWGPLRDVTRRKIKATLNSPRPTTIN